MASAGSFSFSNTGSTITNPTGIAIQIDGGAGGFSYAGAVSKTTDGQAVSVANKTAGTVNLGGAISSTGASDGISLTNNTGAIDQLRRCAHIEHQRQQHHTHSPPQEAAR